MDDDGVHEVPRGQRGELWALAPNKMKGYWRRPDATRETVTEDGWLKTGDIAFQDEEGKLWIVDRKKVQIVPLRLGSTCSLTMEIGINQSERKPGCPSRVGRCSSRASRNTRRSSDWSEGVSPSSQQCIEGYAKTPSVRKTKSPLDTSCEHPRAFSQRRTS